MTLHTDDADTPGGKVSSPASDTAREVDRVVELREMLVDQIVRRHELLGASLPGDVEAVMRRVPRHLFAPGVSLETAYANDSVITKVDERGAARSSVSAPTIVAMMLAQLRVEPGQRVLEIGSGGYNAALLAELVGSDGSVTTLDVDGEVVKRARGCLAAAGYHDVEVLHADGEFGAPEHGPFDRIVVTAGAWDVSPAWREQLVDGGRLVVPLRICGLTRSWALVRRGERLVSDGVEMCGFVPMQGAGAHRGRTVPVHGEDVSLWLDEDSQTVTGTLEGLLATPRGEVWSGVTVGRWESFHHQDLWLATGLPGFGVLTATEPAVSGGLVAPSWRLGTPASVNDGTLAYRAKLRPLDPDDPDGSRYEFGVYAHGPDAARAADLVAEQIRGWDRHQRPTPRLTVLPAGTAGDAAPWHGLVVDKKHSRAVIDWPTPANGPT